MRGIVAAFLRRHLKLPYKVFKLVRLAGQLLARRGTFFAGGAVYLNNGSYLLYSKCYLVCGHSLLLELLGKLGNNAADLVGLLCDLRKDFLFVSISSFIFCFFSSIRSSISSLRSSTSSLSFIMSSPHSLDIAGFSLTKVRYTASSQAPQRAVQMTQYYIKSQY